jgi:hypothetical protein
MGIDYLKGSRHVLDGTVVEVVAVGRSGHYVVRPVDALSDAPLHGVSAHHSQLVPERTPEPLPHHYRPTRQGVCDKCGRAPKSHKAMDARADEFWRSPAR